MKEYKVVINTCYGGFGLSLKAHEYLKDKYGIEYTKSCGWAHFKDEDLERHDSRLIDVVETLGEEANGNCAKLYVKKIYGKQYRITEYDGRESIETPENQEYTYIED